MFKKVSVHCLGLFESCGYREDNERGIKSKQIPTTIITIYYSDTITLHFSNF